MKTENELIAEFMGESRLITRDDNTWIISGQGMMRPHQFEYDTSWDWLMPVVEKINHTETKLGRTDVIIYRNTCHINDPRQILIETTGKDMIECTYKAVVEFIKWYNSQQK